MSTEELERSFQDSWRSTELFFARQIIIYNQTYLSPIYELVFILRMSYAEKLRSGQSLEALMLSRSRMHGLTPDQPFMRVVALAEDNYEVGFFDGQAKQSLTLESLFVQKYEVDTRVKAFIQQLLNCPIT